MIARPLASNLARGLAVYVIGAAGDDSGVGPGLIPALDWNPALGSFASTKGPTPTFSRASAATMVDASGLVVWGPENLVTYSSNQDVGGSWIPGACTVAANSTISPSGATDADSVVEDNTNTFHGINNPSPATVAGTIYTISVYVKAASRGYCMIYTGTGGGTGKYFGLSGSGTVHGNYNANAPISASIESLPNGWYRCSMSITAAGLNSSLEIYAANTSSSVVYAGNGSPSLHVWGAQLERGSVARAYIPTTSAPVYGPRITYDPITHECLGYLAEEARTNVCPQSGNLSVAPWAPYLGTTATANYEQSPILGEMATLVTFPADPGAQLGQGGIPGGNLVLSCWVRCLSGTEMVRLMLYDGTVYSSSNLVVTTTWQRISYAGALTATGQIALLNGADGVARSILCTGFQIEVGNFPTSYIPTTTAAVTRSADVCGISGADFTGFYNQSEGTWVVGSDIAQLKGSNRGLYSVDDGTQSHGFLEYFDEVFPGINAQLRNANILLIGTRDIVAVGEKVKRALAFNLTESASCHNGLPVEILTSPKPSETMIQLAIGSLWNLYSYNGTIARIRYFRKRLPNNVLQALTLP